MTHKRVGVNIIMSRTIPGTLTATWGGGAEGQVVSSLQCSVILHTVLSASILKFREPWRKIVSGGMN